MAEGTQYSPWFSNLWEFTVTSSYTYSYTSKILSPEGDFFDKGPDNVPGLSLITSPWPNWSLEGEIYFDSNPQANFAYINSYITPRYLWMNDLVGDPVSLSTGVTLSFPDGSFQHDLSFFYIGDVNAEFNTTIGRQWEKDDVIQKLWGYAGLGVANKGSPWIHTLLTYENTPCDPLTFTLYGELYAGLGTRNLNGNVPFTGYGPIRYRSIDIGTTLALTTRYGIVTLGADYVIYAYNAPIHAYAFSISLANSFSF